MKKLLTGFVSICFLHSALSFTTDTPQKAYITDGSQADVQAAINAAEDNWKVVVPAGVFTWHSNVSISGKGLYLQGAGSGRVVGRSTSSVSVGAGSKTFTTQNGLNITTGQTLRIERTGTPVVGGTATGVRTFMTGTVTSYSGSNLVMNVTSTGGSGTHPLWILSTMATTTIIHSAQNGELIALKEDVSHNVRVSGLRFEAGTGGKDYIRIRRVNNGLPVLISDCYFVSTADFDCIETDSNRGVVWNCSFAAFPFSRSQLAIHHKNDDATDAWESLSTMGSADIGGMSNLYVEDCDFHAWLNATDFDSNARVVMRRSLFNNTGLGTHGADTSPVGVRHYEVYDSEFVFNGYSNGQTLPLNWWFFLRGGTGVIMDNIMPDMNSQDSGDKAEINITVMNLQRGSGPNPCYNGGYPCPRQVGMGRVTGTAGNDSITYRGDSEPLYIWNNTGNYSVGFSDYGECGSASTSQYVVAGRDFFNNGTPKPGWSKYTYPHPLTLIGNSPRNQPPVALASATPTNGAAPLTVAFSSRGSFDPEGVGLTYNWVFGDGSTASTPNPTNTYHSNGVYSTRLFISDGINTVTVSNMQITVTAPLPPS